MKWILFIVAILITSISIAQKTRTFDVCKSGGVSISATITIDSDNTPIDTIYRMYGRDGRYTQLIEFIVLYRGKTRDIYQFLKYCLDFYTNEQDGTSENRNGTYLSISKYSGMKVLNVYEKDSEGNGYTSFNAAMLKKLILKLEEWANENKVSFK